MTVARPRLNPRLVAGIAVALVMWILVIAGSDPSIDVKEPGQGWVTAQDARSYYDFNLDDLYTGRTEWKFISGLVFAEGHDIPGGADEPDRVDVMLGLRLAPLVIPMAFIPNAQDR